MITYHAGKDSTIIIVKLDGKKVGEIRRLGAAKYQYFPKGKRDGGDIYATLADIQKSLGAPEWEPVESLRVAPDNINGLRESYYAWPSNHHREIDCEGYGFILNACYLTPPCGCKVTGNGTCQLPFTVLFCEAHRKVKVGE